jgi:NifU-like protein involved in Fe-S cluster formation
VRFELSFADGIVTAARFQGDLCMIAKAASSMLTEMVHGASREEIAAFDERRLLDALQAEIRPARMQCVRLPIDTIKAALKDAP